MNSNKKNNNNGWILCPSKSFPGKFYYFNVVSGEAAWSLNELEKRSLKKDYDTPKMSNAFNHYPEPNSPPVANDEIHNTFNTDASYKLRPNCNSMMEPWIPQSQMCSQVLYPKYLPSHSSTYIPNVMWTPVPMSTPMFIRDPTDARKQMSDQNTQTQELKEGTIVQTSGMSLSDRFLSYYTSNNKFNFNDPIKPSRDNNYNKIKDFHKCCINDTKLIALQCKQRFPPLETEMQSAEKGSIIKSPLNEKPENVTKTVFYKGDNNIATRFECSTEIKKIKLDSSLDCTGTQTLDPSDLRLLLLAKKKNNLNIQKTFDKFKGDRRNSNACIELKNAPRKRVTFDLSNCDSNESAFKFTSTAQKDVVRTVSSNQEPISKVNIRTLKSLKKARMRTDVWFIMADLNVLLDDFELVENFVQQDESCQLVIPYAVLTIIRELSTLTKDGSKTVMVSRKIIRRLMDSPRHISLLESVRDVNVSISKQILDCSIKLLERKFHVVLITTDVELLTNAKAFNLPCYMLEQIDGNIERRYTLNDGNKDLFESRNEVYDEGIEQLFLKKPNEFQQFVFDKKPETLDNRRKQIQNINSDNVKNFKRVIKNDVCNETTCADSNFAHIPNVINAEQRINSDRNVNMEKSKYMTLNRIVCNEIDKELNPIDKPAKNLNIQFNSEFLKEMIKRSVNIKEVHNTDLSDNDKVRNDQKQSKCMPGQEQIALDCSEGENIISRQPDLNACSNIHEPVSKNNDNEDLNVSKKLVENSLYDKLKRFYIKDKVMVNRIISRADEWICCFTQIMENVMSHILWDESTTKFINPCTILEAAKYIAKMFGDNKSVEAAVYGLCAMYNLINLNGKLKRNLNPKDILNTIGCGVLLVESLKAAIPRSPQLLETEHSLMHLLHCIEDPSSDPNPYEFKNTPIVSRFDVDEDITTPKSTYVKKRSEVLMYLKKHFPEWKTYDEECGSKNDESNQAIGKSLNVVRTTGRHLSLLKINNVNKLTLTRKVSRGNEITITKKNDIENARHNDTRSKSETVNVNKKFTSDNGRETKYVEAGDYDHLTKHNNTFTTSPQVNNGPSIIRNIGIIECFENKLKTKSLDGSAQNFKEAYNTLDEDSKSKNLPDAISETYTDIAYQTEVNNSDTTNDKITANVRTVTSDISYDDSGLGNENCHAHTTVKSFLIELSSSLKAIYKYLNDSTLEIKQKGVQEHNKKAIHDKTDKTYKLLLLIVDKLKRIIEREPDEDGGTVKCLLIKAGVDVANDKRILRYKQVVTKCLEQAYLLKRGLKLLLFVTGENHDSASIISEPDQSYICHFNIFE